MRGSFASIGKSALVAAALAAGPGVVASLGGLALVIPAAVAKDAPKDANSPEFAKLAGPFQKSFGELEAKKGKVPADDFKAAAVALAPQLKAMEGSVKTGLDRIIYGQWQQSLGNWTGDTDLTEKGFQNMLDSGKLPPDKVQLVGFYLGATAYQNKQFDLAIKGLSPVVASNYSDDAAVQMLAEAYVSTGNPAKGLDAIKEAIATRKAAGGVPPEDWYTRANRIAYLSKLTDASVYWARELAAAYPTPMNWLAAAQLVRNGGSAFTNQEILDVGRLLDRTGALKLDPKIVDREYIEYLQAADPRRFPGEAVRIAEEGIASGALKADDTFVKDALAQARPRVAADKASLPSLAKDALAAPTGVSASAAGDAYLSYGDSAKAAELYSVALSKGGIDPIKDRVLTRLGIAEIDTGKYADAKTALAGVSGIRAPLAKLWMVFADTKAAGK